METMTEERRHARMLFNQLVFLSTHVKKKHMRIPKHYIEKFEEAMFPVWRHLTLVEKECVMFILFERRLLDVKFVGPLGQLALDVFIRRFRTPDFAARFLLSQDKRLN